MRRTWKTALTTLATAGLLFGGGAAAASANSPGAGEPVPDQPPEAAVPTGQQSGSPPCKATLGNLLRTYKNGKWATLEIYWDGANKTNCAFLRHGPKVPGGERPTAVYLWTCKTNKQGRYCTPVSGNPPYNDWDKGNFTTYAGKVSVKGVGKGGKPKCIYAWGYVKAKGKYRYIDVNGKTSASAPPKGKHCG